MKIDRRKFIVASSTAVAFAKSGLPGLAKTVGSGSTNSPSVADRVVKVYTTAANSSHRLSATDALSFKPMGQPLETQICVFVDPSRTFQSFIGIGGALTDASAETFAKLPEAKQQEVLDAYFDSTTGIGYTLARTNIH